MNTKGGYENWSLTKPSKRVFGVALALLLLPLAAGAAGLPQVSTLSATAVTGYGATLNGTVNPNGAPTAAWFLWGATPNPGTPTSGTNMGSGTKDLPLSIPLAGLIPGITYFFCVAATNSEGTVYGTNQVFTTVGPPQVSTLSATTVTNNGATLNGTVNPRGAPTAAWFVWGVNGNNTNHTALIDMGSGTSALPLSFPLSGLAPNVYYTFRVAATNSFGAVYDGNFQGFTTLGPPEVWTSPATAVAASSATLNGSVSPRGYSTAAWFQWGTTSNYGNLTPLTDMGSGTSSPNLSAPLAGLTPGVTYHFRVAATNSNGAAYGSDQNFTTPGPPQVWTLSATAVATKGATLNGTVNPDGYPTAAWFHWGTTTNYGNLTPVTDMGNGSDALPLSVPLAGLTPGVTYHFRIAATNSNGAAYGTDQAFTTRDHADTNTVTSLADSGAGSLRQVIANSATGDSIVFGVTGTITLAGSELVVDKDLTIIGPGISVLAISGGGSVGGFRVYSGVHFTVMNLTVTGGWSDSGAGIYNGGGYLLVQNCLFAHNTASTNGRGGAVFNSGTATITSSTFVGNSAAGAAGSDGTSGPGGAGCGGAVYNLGNLELRDSTFLSNSVRGGLGGRGGDGMSSMWVPSPGGHGGLGGDGDGGALFNAGVATVANSTFTSNSAYGGPGGVGGRGGNSDYTGYPPRYYGGAGGDGGMGGAACGAIYDISGLCFLTNCTLSSNSAFGGAGGSGGPGGSGGLGSGPAGGTGSDGQALGSLRGAGAVLVNTLLSGNAPGGNCSGTIADAGHNLSSDLSYAFTNIGSLNNTDAKLGPLADNGGSTLTMALLPGSPAIDAGDTSLAPATDQRGVPRPFSLAADIGAFEFWPSLRANPTGSGGIDILASGISGQTCRLLASSNFLNWMPLATNQIGSNGTVLFYDTCAPGRASRFYRLVMP